MKRAMLLAAAIAVVSVSMASAGGKANTRVTLDYIATPPSGETIYTGDIFSPRRACKNNRPVIVFRARPGADDKIGVTRSFKGSDQPGYFWILTKDDTAPAGNYYSKVKPTDACQGDRSATYEFSGFG